MEHSDPFGQYNDHGDSRDEFDVPSVTVETLEQALRRMELLEQKLVEARLQLTQSRSNNEKLAITIQQTRDQIAALRDEVEKLTQPPAVYGTFIEFNPDGTADIFASGRKMRVSVHPGLDPGQVERGHEVVLNESFAIIGVRNPDGQGFAAFGHVTDGMRLIREIWSSKTQGPPGSSAGELIASPVQILGAHRV